MKVVITGHTSGIGACLFQIYKNQGHEVIGYSRSTGSDIEDSNIRKVIIEQNLDCDIFINNAYSATGQTNLLKELIEKWNGQERKIINISSKLSFVSEGKIPDLDPYIKQKLEQNKIAESRFSVASPQIMNVIVGLVDTPMSSIFESKKLNPESLSKLIYDMSLLDQFYIQQMIIDVPGLDWKNIKVTQNLK
jgi:short-subunit dehydrogenase involved in D-alanine esterification of teichoic acids